MYQRSFFLFEGCVILTAFVKVLTDGLRVILRVFCLYRRPCLHKQSVVKTLYGMVCAISIIRQSPE